MVIKNIFVYNKVSEHILGYKGTNRAIVLI